MSEEYRHYESTPVMRSKDQSTLRITDIWKFRSAKSNKWYIVEMEHFDYNLIAIKFYYKGARLSKQRYSLMTNDNEPRTIVYSCLELMRRYYVDDNTVSFGFVAAPDIEPSIRQGRGNRRFRFYRRVVNYYFGPKTFVHLHDGNERLYLMLNKRQIDAGCLSVNAVSEYINNLFEGDYDFD